MSLTFPENFEKIVALKDGTNVKIRPMKESDVDLLLETCLHLESGGFPEIVINRDILEGWIRSMKQKKRIIFVGEMDNNGRPQLISFLTLQLLDHPYYRHRAEMGAGFVSKPYRGTGVLTEMAKHLINVARLLGLKKLGGPVEIDNPIVTKVALELGGIIEGTLKMDKFRDGKFRDVNIVSIFL